MWWYEIGERLHGNRAMNGLWTVLNVKEEYWEILTDKIPYDRNAADYEIMKWWRLLRLINHRYSWRERNTARMIGLRDFYTMIAECMLSMKTVTIDDHVDFVKVVNDYYGKYTESTRAHQNGIIKFPYVVKHAEWNRIAYRSVRNVLFKISVLDDEVAQRMREIKM